MLYSKKQTKKLIRTGNSFNGISKTLIPNLKRLSPKKRI